jgi:putative sterol carrier protein
VKERADPDFDYEAELQALLALWQGELQAAACAPGGQP